jgi:thermitase
LGLGSEPRKGNEIVHRTYTALLALSVATALGASPALGADGELPLAPPTPAPSYVPGSVIVEWKSGVSATERAHGRADARTTAVATLGATRFQLVHVESGQSVDDAIAALKADPNVRVAERDGYSYPTSVPNDPLFPQEWGLRNLGVGVQGFTGAVAGDDIEALPGWDRAVGSPATVVADIDSGYRFNHEDLASVAWTNPSPTFGDLHGADFVGTNADHPTTDGDPTDDDLIDGGHGVHTAGTIGAAGNNGVGVTGVAQNVRIMPLRVCAHSPSANAARCPNSAIVAAMNYAGAQGARVANLSLGGTTPQTAERDAMASHPQTLYVIAAGNDAQDNDIHLHNPCNYDPSTSGIPGSIDNVICVAATDQADHLASFSDWGATTVDVGAPGTEILSTFPSTPYFSDDFETDNFATRWTATGANGGFARTNESPLTSFGMSDSPGAAPVAGTTRSSTSAAVAVPAGAGSCTVSGTRTLTLGGGTFSYSVLRNGSAVFTSVPSSSGAFQTIPIGGLAGANVQLRFVYTAGSSPTASSGVWLDDLKLTCINPISAATGYDFLQGTSMAAPNVTGAAALLFSLKPSATVSEVKSTLLSTVTPDPALAGKTTSGGRIDVSRALDALVPPDTTIDGGPAASTTSTTATFAFHRSDSPAAATFECQIDGGAFGPCASPVSFGAGLGAHTFAVRSRDPHGNADPTPASAAWTVVSVPAVRLVVVRCVVPKLKRKTLAAAKKALRKAHCATGKVTRPKHAKGKLVVKSSSPKAGATRAAGTRIKLALRKKR